MSTPISDFCHIFDRAAELSPAEAVQTTCNLQLLELQRRCPDGDFPEFVSWKQLRGILPELFDRYWGPFTADRRAMLQAIDDWRLGPTLCDRLTAALVDPIARSLASTHARQWSLLCHLHVDRGIEIPGSMMVLDIPMNGIASANRTTSLPQLYKLIISRANYLALHSSAEALDRCRASSEAQHREHLAARLACIHAMTRGVLLALLDGTLTRRS